MGAVSVEVGAFAESAGTEIFNNAEGMNDGKRILAKWPRGRYKDFLKDLEAAVTGVMMFLLLWKGSSTHTFDVWAAIKSRAGCKEQRAHTDYDPKAADFRRSATLGEHPYSAIFALEKGTSFVVYGPASTATRRTRRLVSLERGDLLIFRGDVVHAGAAYRKPNTRVHVYIDHARVRRDRDMSWDAPFEKGSEEPFPGDLPMGPSP